jgi:hypothetical protein
MTIQNTCGCARSGAGQSITLIVNSSCQSFVWRLSGVEHSLTVYFTVGVCVVQYYISLFGVFSVFSYFRGPAFKLFGFGATLGRPRSGGRVVGSALHLLRCGYTVVA